MSFIKTILVPFYGDEREVTALEGAFLLAKQHHAHLRCLHVSPDAKAYNYRAPIAPMPIYQDLELEIQKQLDKKVAKAHQRFEEVAKKYGVHVTDGASGNADIAEASWHHEYDTQIEAAIAKHGKIADVIVVSQIINAQHGSTRSAIVAALFETGRPVLVIPQGKTPAHIGQHVVIAWDASKESSHAVALARPLLAQAEKVCIVTVDEEDHKGPLAQDLSLYLLAHNIASDHVSVAAGSLSVGSALMEEAKKQQADMIVMGAFAHSRMRQVIIGGATSFMLDRAELPVWMVH
jgi:nucleotide-binding universal stress UspA family protein